MIADRSSPDARRAPSPKTVVACLLASALAACAGGHERPAAPIQTSLPPPTPQPSAPTPAPRAGLTPSFMAGKPVLRIGVLLPFSTSGSEAQSLYDAAELAMFDHGDSTTLLIPHDSGRDAGAASAAAEALLKDGADVVVGPISKDQVGAISGELRTARVPVIGFSTDATVAGSGVYLLTYPFEEEVHRIVEYASSKGITRFAILAPNTEYGRRVDAAFRQDVAKDGGAVVAGIIYPRTDRDAATAAQSMVGQARAASAQAVLIADDGSPLREIGQTLLQASFDTKHIKLLGTGLWATDAQREPSLTGGWYAAPDPNLRTAFDARYRAVYNRAPARLAGLAYDAVAVTETLARGQGAAGVNAQALERRDGFLGADGVFRFKPDGTVQRGLAVLEVQPGAPLVVDPAPTALTNRSF